jgi:hypothetical protein
MNGLLITGVTRANEFSPNHIDNDAAIFDAVARELRAMGGEVTVTDEDTFASRTDAPLVIFNMARRRSAVDRLVELEQQGTIVVNSGRGILNCTRERMTRLFIANDVPHPRSLVVNTNEQVFPHINRDRFIPCWIKRGDFHAVVREDVCFAASLEEGQRILGEMASRGIARAVINEHLEGDLVKFYGVAHTGFFHWFYPADANHSKFGLEAVNGKSKGYKFDLERMKEIVMRAAEVLDVSVFGGDCIVGADGSIRIIDFNDWPSFAPCRDEAAPYIARLIMDEAVNGKEPRQRFVYE